MNIRKNWKTLVVAALSLGIIFTNQLHGSYPDEFENILGGRYITHGQLPYTGFFTHHNPFAFFFAAPLTIFSGQSFVRFRFILGLVYFVMAIAFFKFIKSRFGILPSKIISGTYIFLLFGATYFWGHMLLADVLAGYFISAAYVTIIFHRLTESKIRKHNLWLVSLLIASSVLTTPAVSIAALILYIYIFWLVKRQKTEPNLTSLVKIILFPYIIFLLYLLLTFSLPNYYRQVLHYNANYYVQLPEGVTFKNPLRVLITLFVKNFESFKSVLTTLKDLPSGNPFIQALGLGNLTFIIFLLLQDKKDLALLVSAFLIYINFRSNPYTTAETDYQAISYHIISLFNGVAALVFLWEALKSKLTSNRQATYSLLMVYLSIYNLFLLAHFTERWLDKTYLKYMGRQPLIYDRPSVAPLLNKLLGKNDYYYIGPFDFENHLYMNRKLASKYFIVLPGMDQSAQMQSEILNDLKTHKPKIIVFNTEERIYEMPPGRFLVDYLHQEYFNLEDLGMPCSGYAAVNKWYGNYDSERHFFFDKNLKDEIWNLLLKENLIHQLAPEEVLQKYPYCINRLAPQANLR